MTTKLKILGNLRDGPTRLSTLREAVGVSVPAIRTAISRLRAEGWDIICDSGADPKYTLQRPTPLPPHAIEQGEDETNWGDD